MISSIRLQNFRSYRDGSFEFYPGVNIIVGSNASGKTNLLEAVATLAGGSSFKARDNQLIKVGKPWARVEGVFEKQKRALKLEATGEKPTKSFIIDDNQLKRLGFERTQPVVIFEPNHLLAITRGPEGRREFIDDILERTKPGFKNVLANYRRALAQRNNLLKRGSNYGASQLFAWDVRLGELGAQIAGARQQLVDQLNKQLSKTYGQISGKKTKINVSYQSQFPIGSYASQMVAKLGKSAKQDFERGFTGHGPHREDLVFYLNAQDLNQTASRGESRSLLLALKAIELNLVEASRGQKPIFLLDDVFSELDAQRRRALVDMLDGTQAILTTTDADSVLEYFSGKHHTLFLNKK